MPGVRRDHRSDLFVKNSRLACLCLALACAASPFAQEVPAQGRKYSSIERLEMHHLRAVHADRLRLASRRHPVRLATGYTDYRAVLHAHAEDSSHTGGTRPELLAAAKRSGVSIIMLSDHVRPGRDFINDSWRGLKDGVLWIPGAESQGFLVFPLESIQNQQWQTRADYIRLIKDQGGNIFLSHVEERLDWDTAELDGMEIYNHHTDVLDDRAFSAWLQAAIVDPVRLEQLTRALAEYPQEVFGSQQDYLGSIIAKWDRDTQQHRSAGIAANDCHHNQVFTVTVVDAQTVEVGYIGSRPTSQRITAAQNPKVAELARLHHAGEVLGRLDFDPYERSLSYVSTHVLSKSLDEAAIRQALRAGHAYVAHDWLAEPTQFAFVAAHRGRRIGVMGDEIEARPGLKLRAATTLIATLKLFRNGSLVKSVRNDRLDFAPRESGVYRLEAWLELDGEQRPWIYSNPIYVR
jgi:hypothetical protein